MRTTVISHFWNNAAILPYWLSHHKRLFDHGILIDHGATDGSADLIRKITPRWEVRETRRCKEHFIAGAADEEVMGVEEGVEGWKMVLNVTEFLVHYDLKRYIRRLPSGVRGVTTSGVVLVEHPEQRHRPLDDRPPFLQKTYGYFEYELGKRPEDYGVPGVWRSRLLHNYPDGDYEVGRHVTRVAHVHDPNLFLAWAGWAPFELIKRMKMQVQTRIPKSDFDNQFSVQHKIDSEDELEARLRDEQSKSHDLRDDPRYAMILARIEKTGLGLVLHRARNRMRRLLAG